MAVYRLSPLACFRVLIVAMVKMETWIDGAAHVSYMSPRQTVNCTEYAEIPQKHR
jgi:hypothetical protein